jgi:hypothetical protein
MLVDVSAVEPSPLCPDPDRRTWRRRGRTCPGPPLVSLCPLHVADRRDLASTDPQCPVAATKPHQHTPKAAAPGFARARGQAPPSMPLETLAPARSRAYKNPPSTPRRSTHSPLPIPTLLFSSLPRSRPVSMSERRRVSGDSGRCWSFCWCKVEERSSRRRSATSPSSPASSPSRPRRRTLVPARR